MPFSCKMCVLVPSQSLADSRYVPWVFKEFRTNGLLQLPPLMCLTGAILDKVSQNCGRHSHVDFKKLYLEISICKKDQELEWCKETHSITQIHLLAFCHIFSLSVYMILFFLSLLRSCIFHGSLLLITSV